MKTVGIISEYNPFHNGHRYQIQRAKEITGADFAVIVMNGDFVQRGEPAIFDKYTRTRQALEGGADLVFELPVRFGISSAGDFALGGVLALTGLSFVDALCFGSECGNIRILSQIAAILEEEPEAFVRTLTTLLKQGFSYPAAQAQALSALDSIPDAILRQPNNILGIEYCRAVSRLRSPLRLFTIPRVGQGYHEELADGEQSPLYPSATALRYQIRHSVTPHLCLDDCSDMIGYALRTCNDLTVCKDISPDLADRMTRHLSAYHTAGDFVQRCQTRAFTTGRVRRAMLQCLLGIRDTPPVMPYLRLLGMKKGAGCLLKHTGSCTILSHLASDGKKLSDDEQLLLAGDLLASDLYRQVYCRKYQTKLPNEYQRSPIVLP